MSALLAVAAVVVAAASAPPAPGDRARLDSLADATAAAITRFADRGAAIAAGYRRIGTDFPGMGEHWVHGGVLLAGRIDAARPTILAYATIAGRPTLLGAGFVVTTRGEARADAPGWPAYWHEHSGLLGDESGVRPRVGTRAPDATRVWVLHVWTALPNPADRYDADNWALPFARLGLPAPTDLDPDVGRAASLLAGGDAYLARLLADAGLARDPSATAALERAIDAARRAVEPVVTHAREARSSPDAPALRAAWRDLADRLRAIAGPGVEPLLAPPHAHHGDAGARHAPLSAAAAPARSAGRAPAASRA